MKRFILTAAIALATIVSASAQGLSSVSASYGWYSSGDSDIIKGSSYIEADYSRFFANHWSFRTGAQFLTEGQAFGVPLSVVYNTDSRNAKALLQWGVDNAARSMVFGVLHGDTNALSNAVYAFLTHLFNKTEIYAGITPGLLASSYGYGNAYLSFDVGAALNFAIRNVDIKASAAAHYFVAQQPIGSHFNFGIGAAYHF